MEFSTLPPFDDGFGVTAPAAAAAVIRGYCRWHIWPQVTETLVKDGPGAPLLLLPTLKLVNVTAMSQTHRGRGQVTTDLDAAADLDWSEAGMVWHVDGWCWSSKPRGISITFTHGYDAAPSEIIQLATALAKRAASNPARLKRMQVGQRSEDYETAGLLRDEMAILDPYRRVI